MVSVKCDSNMAKSFILNGNHEKFIIMAVSQQGTLCTVIALKVTQHCKPAYSIPQEISPSSMK